MPRGRPKVVVPPCRHCGRQFKRNEHLKRHERTHTEERPFPCACGQSFSRLDLLARHVEFSHPPSADTVTTRPDNEETPNITISSQPGLFSDADIFWNPELMAQGILPANLFDPDLPLLSLPQANPAPQLPSFSRFSFRLPQANGDADGGEPTIEGEDNEAHQNETHPIFSESSSVPWSITDMGYDVFCETVLSYSAILPAGCTLPSKNALSRNLESYFRCAQENLPFIHSPTYSIEMRDIELTLAVAASGSLFRFEHTKAYELYLISKAILFEKIRQRDIRRAAELLGRQKNSAPNDVGDVAKIQTFILLISFASWSDKAVLPDALSMGSQLAVLARQNGITESDEMPQDIDWLSWVAIEEKRRSLFAAYIVLNLHSIAFNIPPLILNHEISIFLPGSSEQWKSVNAIQWHSGTHHSEYQFRNVLYSLFHSNGSSQDTIVSSFANYVLIQGLLQQIYLRLHGSVGLSNPETPGDFEIALSNWQSSWERTDDSTLDPLSTKGPVALNAAALFRLAHIRLNVDLDLHRGLFTRDFGGIKGKQVDLAGSPHIDVAVIHAAHALSIPVRLGIELVARTRLPMKSIEHSLCSFECALLLKYWLEMVSRTVESFGTEGLRPVERRILGIITEVIKETYLSEALESCGDDLSRIRYMAAAVVKLWARMFQGTHVLSIDNVIGAGLELLVESTLD